MDKHVSPNRHQVLADVSGNKNNDEVTMDKETMNEQEIDRWNKKTYGKTYKRKVSNLKTSCDIRRSDFQTCKWMAIVEITEERESLCFIVFWSVFKTNDDLCKTSD